ncbi:MAG: TetR/AcrR family transcriptional regulator [Pseudomonadota bacterium]
MSNPSTIKTEMNRPTDLDLSNCVRLPQRPKAKKTFENIVLAGQQLLDELGLESFNTNAIAERAGVTAPVFYHYFKNKHALLRVLAERLMQAQDDVFVRHSAREPETPEELEAVSLAILRETYELTKCFVGARALLVSLRAIPELAHIRIKANETAAALGAQQLSAVFPKRSKKESYERAWLGIEIGYSAIELLLENENLSTKRVLNQTAKAVVTIYFQ